MHEVKKECDMWISWFENSDGIDQRVYDFFRDAVDKAKDVYEEEIRQYRRREQEVEQEKTDKLEYERLKKKYQG